MPASDQALVRMPLHRLFPDAHEESCRMIRRDFTMYGTSLVGMLLFLRVAEFAITGR